jgi:hypothetical protein
MGKHRRFLAAALFSCIAGCSTSGPTTPTAPSQPTTHAVSGTVFEIVDGVLRPVAGQFLVLLCSSRKRLGSRSA